MTMTTKEKARLEKKWEIETAMNNYEVSRSCYFSLVLAGRMTQEEYEEWDKDQQKRLNNSMDCYNLK